MLQITTPDMRAQQAYHYTPLRTNFFTLLRFDFMLDEHGNTYLIEVGVSSGPWLWAQAQALSLMFFAWV